MSNAIAVVDLLAVVVVINLSLAVVAIVWLAPSTAQARTEGVVVIGD